MHGLAVWASFDPQALTSLTDYIRHANIISSSFDPQALTSLTNSDTTGNINESSFDPQALTSLTELRRALAEYADGVSIHRLLRA